MRELRPGAIRSHNRQKWRQFYAAYINSAEWFRRRERWALEEAGRRPGQEIMCVGECSKAWTLADHLHHRSYARLGAEAHDDLWPMCADCHYRLHALIESRPWRKKPKQTANMQALQVVRSQNTGTAGNQSLAVRSLGRFL